MKITFVMEGSFGLAGGDRVIANYAEKLYQRGHEVLVIAADPYKPVLKDQVRSLLKGKGWIPTNLSQPSHFDDKQVPHRLLEGRRPVADCDLPDADVVIATWWETAEWVANLSPAKGAKAYFIQGYEVFDHLPKHRVEATYRLPIHKITISKWLMNILETRYGQKDIDLVPNSVDTDMFYAPKRTRQPQPTVGFVYSSLPCKGTDIVLKAYALAKQRIPELRLVGFGQGLVPDLPLPEGVEFVCKPPQTTLKDFYSKCDEEGFGLPILEAMACRTPVIATPAGAAPEILSQGGGMLVVPEDPEAIARGIERICQLSELEWQALSEAAYTIATGYTLEQSVSLFEAALGKAVQSALATQPQAVAC